MSNNEKPVYITYSAEDRKQADAIRAKYVSPEEKQLSNLEQMKKLDAKVESKAVTIGLCIGILSALIFGVGMTFFLVWGLPLLGVVIGLIGLVGMGAAWPLYQKTLQKEREKAAPEIMRLSKEE